MTNRMKKPTRRWFVVVLGAMVLSLAVLWHQSLSHGEDGTAQDHRSSTSGSQVKSSDLSRLQSKLDQVLDNQQTILKKFDAVMDELRIIKVRATIK